MYGMRAVFNNASNEDLLDKSVILDLKEHQFKIDKITLIKVIDNYTCDVVAKDSKGHRSYRVQLAKSSRYPHLFKIQNIKGQKIKATYQWRDL
jgi:hypothetical protein